MARASKSDVTENGGKPAGNAGEEEARVVEDEEKKARRERYLADGLDPSCYGL